MSLHFPGFERPPFPFQIDQPQLDSAGFVIDFKEIAVRSPANGKVKISKTAHLHENEALWILYVHEENEDVQAEVAADFEQHPSPETPPEVVNRTTKLTKKEIAQMSREVGIYWDNLAALMDMPYPDHEEIRYNSVKYSTYSSKARQVLEFFNDSECFDRNTLVKYLKELKLNNVKKKMLAMDDESESEEMGIGETATSQPEMELQDDTPLSSREMYRLSRHIVADWNRLAAVLDVATGDRDEVRYNGVYHTSHSRGEKMLSIFNNMEDFSRRKLAECFEEIGQLELKDPVITGEWRK